MPVIPFAVAIGTALTVGGAVAGGIALSSAASAKKAATVPTNPTPDASQTVGDLTPNQTAQAQNNGRAALISTSPSGVSGTDPTGRRKLLGND